MIPKCYTTNRAELERQALFSIGAWYYYDLADTITELSDDALQAIVQTGDVEAE